MIIIPMAGASSRFYKAGYIIPKYELLLGDKTVFECSIMGFRNYFLTEVFLFIVLKKKDTVEFIKEITKTLGIKYVKIFELDKLSLGQADTVYKALKSEQDQPITIFNIDTFLLDYKRPSWIDQCDGYLEVFKGEGDHWSFVNPGKDNSVLRTTEKDRISNLCSNGLYYFKSSDLFKKIVEDKISNNDFVKGELYVAPIYNELIRTNKIVKYNLTNKSLIKFCGTPEEYQFLKDKIKTV